MMAMGFMEMLMILLGGGATGNDLLDMIQTKAYWDQAGVTITTKAMSDELKDTKAGNISALIADLVGDDSGASQAAAARIRAKGAGVIPQLEKAIKKVNSDKAGVIQDLIGQLYTTPKARAVRRLMAIRALGEMKKTDALATLNTLLKSKEQFEAEYARAAIAMIEGKKFTRPSPTAKDLEGDLWLLPAGCGLVAQVRMDPGKPMDIAKALKDVKKMPGGQNADAAIKMLTSMLVMGAERAGNVRLDAITFGLSKEVSNRAGFVVVILRGKYDAKAMRSVLGEMKRVKTETIDGVEVIRPDREFAFIAISNDRAVIVGGPNRDGATIPVAEMIAAVKTGKGKLASDGEMAKLVKTVNRKGNLWAAAKMSGTYREASILAPFDTITASSRKVKDGRTIEIVGIGSDAEKVAAAVTEVQNGIQEGRREMTKMAERTPMFKQMADLLAGIKVQAKDTTATMTVNAKSSLMMPMMLMTFGAGMSRQVEGEIPGEVQIDPAPGQPGPKPDDF